MLETTYLLNHMNILGLEWNCEVLELEDTSEVIKYKSNFYKWVKRPREVQSLRSYIQNKDPGFPIPWQSSFH